MLHGLHLTASEAARRMGGEAEPLVSQNGDRAEVLHAIQAYFGCGSIRPDRSDKTVKWETRRLEDILERVDPALRGGTRCCRASGTTSNGSQPSAGSWPTARIGAATV